MFYKTKFEMKTNLTYLFVGDVLGAYKAIYHS